MLRPTINDLISPTICGFIEGEKVISFFQQKELNLLKDPQSAKILDGFLEVEFLNNHNNINGVEVFFTVKASSQVCPGVCGCVEFRADRAEEAKVTI